MCPQSICEVARWFGLLLSCAIACVALSCLGQFSSFVVPQLRLEQGKVSVFLQGGRDEQLAAMVGSIGVQSK